MARACFITNTALELVPQDREVADVIEHTFRRMSTLWSQAAMRAHEAGVTVVELRIDPDRSHDPKQSQNYASLQSLKLA